MNHHAVFAVLLLVSAPIPAAWAEDVAGQGIDLYAEGRYRKAIAELTRAAARTQAPGELARIQLYIGFSHALLDEAEAARSALLLALEHDPDLVAEPRRFKPALRELLARVRAETALLRITASGAADIRILVDGKAAGVSPCRRRVAAGEHRVVAKGDGVEQTRVVRLAAGEERALTFQLAFRLAESTPEPAALPGATSPTQPPEPVSFWARKRVWTWVAAGGAAGFGAACLGVYLSALFKYEAFDTARTEFNNGSEEVTRTRLEEMGEPVSARLTAGNVLAGIAGAAAVTAVVLLFVEGRPQEPSSASQRGIGLGISPTGLSLSVPLP